MMWLANSMDEDISPNIRVVKTLALTICVIALLRSCGTTLTRRIQIWEISQVSELTLKLGESAEKKVK